MHKFLVAFERTGPKCNECNWGLVRFGDRAGISAEPRAAERRKMAKALGKKITAFARV